MSINTIEKKTVQATNVNGKIITGKVILVFQDAVASGTNEYVPLTYLSVEDKNGCVHTVRPRDVIQTIKRKVVRRK